MKKKNYVIVNLILTPFVAILFFPLAGNIAYELNLDSVILDLVLPVSFSSLTISMVTILFSRIFFEYHLENIKDIVKTVLISLLISLVLSPITLGFVVTSGYFLYCKFGSC